MIVVLNIRGAWYWNTTGGGLYAAQRARNAQRYDSPDHALRDAWTWLGRDVPALIYTRRS